MKKINKFIVSVFAGSILLSMSACVQDLLDQQATTGLDSSGCWRVLAAAVGGATAMCSLSVKVFHRDYFVRSQGGDVGRRAVCSNYSLARRSNGRAYWTG